MKVIIIEDEKLSAEHLTVLLQKIDDSIEVTHYFDSIKSVVNAFQSGLSAELIFMDIHLADGNSFEIFKHLSIEIPLIFTTAYDQYALPAFKQNSIDYLLKPLDPTDLIEAVNKAEESLNKEVFELKMNTLFANLERPKDLQKLVLKTAEKIYSVNIQDIVNCESDKNYTTFYFINAPKLVVSTNLKEYETLLTPHNFFRTHKSHLINMAYFDHFIKSEGGNTIVMKNKSAIPLSVRKKEEFMVLLDNL